MTAEQSANVVATPPSEKKGGGGQNAIRRLRSTPFEDPSGRRSAVARVKGRINRLGRISSRNRAGAASRATVGRTLRLRAELLRVAQPDDVRKIYHGLLEIATSGEPVREKNGRLRTGFCAKDRILASRILLEWMIGKPIDMVDAQAMIAGDASPADQTFTLELVGPADDRPEPVNGEATPILSDVTPPAAADPSPIIYRPR